MSVWVHVTATYEIDTWRPTSKIRSIVRKIMRSAPEISGSEGSAEVFLNFPSGHNVWTMRPDGKNVDYQTRFIITINGHLRDRAKCGVQYDLQRFEEFIADQPGWEIVISSSTVEEN